MKQNLSIVLYTQGLSFDGDTLDQQSLGGAESAFTYLGRELSRLGHQVKAFCPCPRPGDYAGVIYQDISTFPDWIKNESCDLFICSRYQEVFKVPLPAKVKVLWLHDHLLEHNAADIRPLLPSIDFIYCVSNYHAAYTGQFFQNLQDKIQITSNGVDLEMVKLATQDVHEKKHQIMFTSRPERGLAEALYVFEKLNDKSLDFLACSYPYPNEDLAQSFHQQMETLRQKGFKVRMEQFNKRDLYRNIAESKVVIYPSNTPEIFCISAVEAQACRTAFLGRQAGALTETVAYPCQKGNNPELFFRAVKKVLEDVPFRQSLEQLGWQHVQKYTWDRVAKQFAADAHDFLLEPRKTPEEKVAATARYWDRIAHWSTPISGEELPKITCLMELRGSIINIKQSIQSFLNQSYPNKELLLVYQQKEQVERLHSYLEYLASPQVMVQQVEELELLQEMIFKNAEEDLLCWWNATDLYHPNRLFYQYRFFLEEQVEGVVLKDYLQTDHSGLQLYWMLRQHSNQALLASKAVCKKLLEDSNAAFGEWAALLQEALTISDLPDFGFLYLRRSPNEAIANIHRQGQGGEYLSQRQGLLQQELQHYPLPQPLQVFAKDGKSVFVYKNG